MNAGQLNPAILGSGAVDIVVRITLQYTVLDDTDNESEEQDHTFEATVKPEEWTNPPCSYLQDDCIVFQNEKVILYAPDAPGLTGVLSIAALDVFTANSTVNVVSESCDLRCDTGSNCTRFETAPTIDLDAEGPGTRFGTVVQSTFNNGFCIPSIFSNVTDSFSYSYSYSYSYSDYN